MNQEERIQRFTTVLWTWFETHRRDLPWRDLWQLSEGNRAYRVWISEVMLQQTQVSRVIGSYKKFIQQFPHLIDLANASNREILLAWRGMGYNSRALRLRDGAQTIVQRVTLGNVSSSPSTSLRTGSVENHVSSSGVENMVRRGHHDMLFPRTMEELIDIPGIGAYTAGAIRTFAFDLPTVCIDINIRRILHRTFIGPENQDGTWKADDAKLSAIMNEVMRQWSADGHRGSDLLSALMDYGSLVQTKTNPTWEICVLTEAGIMKATRKNWKAPIRGAAKEKLKTEPGRYVGSIYIPNRIFRGRVVEALRDHPQGLKLEEVGKWISPDHKEELRVWLQDLIKKLVQDKMVMKKGAKYVLAE